MRNRELRHLDQRWTRRGLFVQRRRFPWYWILVLVVLGALGYALTRTDLRGLWGSIETRLPAPEAVSEPQSDPAHLPLPPPDQG
jgi:hypothetical protein